MCHKYELKSEESSWVVPSLAFHLNAVNKENSPYLLSKTEILLKGKVENEFIFIVNESE